MKTVRLSDSLRYAIRNNAEKKWTSANPVRQYPQDGMKVFTGLGYQQKIDQTMEHFKSTWGYDCPVNEVNTLVIAADVVEPDDDGEGNDYHYEERFSLTMPDVPVPQTLCKYSDEMHVKVDPTDETFVQCMDVKMFNSKRDDKLREYNRNIREVLERFATLNQLMKAAPYIKDCVPQDRLQKMHEKDDRSERVKQQADLAENELSELREVLLEDALLGDDS